MNVTYQIMDQMLNTVQTAVGQSQSQSGADRSQFESMIQEKYQQAKGQTETAREPSLQEKPQADGETNPAVDQEATEQQYAMAAALMAACQIVQAPQDGLPVQMAQEQAPQAAQVVTAPQMAAENPAQMGRTVVSEETAERSVEVQPLQSAEVEPKLAAVQPQEAQPQAEQSQVSADAGGQKPAADGEMKLETADAAPEPLFADVKATPVKVAPPAEQPVELAGEDGAKALAERLNQAMEQGSSKVEVSLSPRTLGNLTVEITRSGDGSLSVVLSATTTKAAAMLEQHSSNLQNLLMASTQAQVKVEVHGGQESTAQQFLNPDGQNGQNQHQQGRQQEPQREKPTQDFIQRLRLGLVELDQAVS